MTTPTYRALVKIAKDLENAGWGQLPPQRIHRIQRIHRPPGAKMLALIEFFCSKKTYGKVFEPIIADLHEEYFEALDKQQHWKARWIRIRYTWAFFIAIGLNLSLHTIKNIVNLWKTIG